ncbi:MAG: LysR family transcriptional regulator [Pseudomonadota bacterium]|nr:LysR family transcriptional regulator [Pseudomonadota bacterium]
MDTLTGMRLFNKVVETGSFSAAGRAVGLAPSSVSRQISGLEDQLGTRLFNRTTRNLHLTEAGEIYNRHVELILSDVVDANAAVTNLQQEPRGTLRLNVPVVFGRQYIATTMPEFLGQYPKLSVDLQVTNHYIDLIEDGADLAIRVGGLTNTSFIARKLVGILRVLVASPEYLRKYGVPELPEDLSAHNCLRFRVNPGESHWELRNKLTGKTSDIHAHGNLQANNVEAVNAAMLNGGGIALLPSWVVGKDIKRGDAIIVLPDYHATVPHLDSAIYAVYPYTRNVSPKVRAYIDFIVAKFKTESDFQLDDVDKVTVS